MSSIINTNSLSLITQNNLVKSQSSLTTAIHRQPLHRQHQGPDPGFAQCQRRHLAGANY
jgi:hypothetical protein